MSNTIKINQFIQAIGLEIQKLKMLIEPTEANPIVFERNCRNGSKLSQLERFLDHVNKHKEMIGKEVYQLERSFNYSLECVLTGVHNKTQTESVLFTQELFEDFVVNFKKFRTEYLIDDLIKGQIAPNSSSPLNNLVNAWNLEGKQELIKFFNDFYL